MSIHKKNGLCYDSPHRTYAGMAIMVKGTGQKREFKKFIKHIKKSIKEGGYDCTEKECDGTTALDFFKEQGFDGLVKFCNKIAGETETFSDNGLGAQEL